MGNICGAIGFTSKYDTRDESKGVDTIVECPFEGRENGNGVVVQLIAINQFNLAGKINSNRGIITGNSLPDATT